MGSLLTTPVVQITPDATQRFIARHPTSQAQHDAVLSALACTCAELLGLETLRVLLETQGRVPLEGPAPLQAVGSFAASFPIRIGRDDRQPARLRALIDAAPRFGLSFHLLKYACEDAEVSAVMHALPVPEAAFSYRGRWLDFYREDSAFPVLARSVLGEPPASPQCMPALNLVAGLEGGRLWSYLIFDSSICNEDLAGRLLASLSQRVSAA